METEQFVNNMLFLKLGGGTIAGIAVGYAVKRVSKLVLLLLGLVILGLYGLMEAKIITVHWEAVSQGLEEGSRSAGHWMSRLVKDLSVSLVGFGIGFLMGVKIR